MASKETDQFQSAPTTFIEIAGTSLKAALDVSRKYGAVREQVLPFASGKLFSGEEKAFYARAAQFKISSYFNLTLRRPSDIEEWRRWLAEKGPILTRLNVDRTWHEARDNSGNLDSYRAETKGGGHAIALVGYTPDRFIVRNSWGTSWGDKGFGYASLAYAQDAFTEAYGVSPYERATPPSPCDRRRARHTVAPSGSQPRSSRQSRARRAVASCPGPPARHSPRSRRWRSTPGRFRPTMSPATSTAT